MKIQIKHRWDGSVLFEGKFGSLKLCLQAAVSSGADLSGAYLSRADLSGADLSRADLSRADLSRAYLSGADLSGAYLSRADLSGADLSGADLSRADLSRAYLSGADLSRAYLSGADLSRADLGDDQKCTIPPKFFLGGNWDVTITDGHIKIGCEVHTTAEWKKFTNKRIAEMDGLNALKFWKQWKAGIMALATAHQAKVEK